MAARPLAGNGDRPAAAGKCGTMASTMNGSAMNGRAAGNGTAVENSTEMSEKAGPKR
jgi:hypothetical protein